MTDGGYASFHIGTTFVHLSVDARATPVPDFQWSPEFLAGYSARFRADRGLGRLVMMAEITASWEAWERHPAGEELVISCNATIQLHREIDGEVRTVRLDPGSAIVNPTNVWHTIDVIEPGFAVLITPGEGTEHRSR